MDNILDFIFDNIFWVIMAFIFLSGLGKSKKKRDRTQAPPVSQAPQMDMNTNDDWLDDDDEEEAVFVPERRQRPIPPEMEKIPKPLRDIIMTKMDDWAPPQQKKPVSQPWQERQPWPESPSGEGVGSTEGTGYGSLEGVSMQGPPIVPRAGAAVPTIAKGAAMVLDEASVSPVLQNIARSVGDKDRVREAVIWAEIFGQPKARRH